MATRLEQSLVIANVAIAAYVTSVFAPASVAVIANAALGWFMGEVSAVPADDRLAARGGEHGFVKSVGGREPKVNEITFHGEHF